MRLPLVALAASLVATLIACGGEDPAPGPEGVAPNAPLVIPAPEPRALELEAPPEPVPVATPEPVPTIEGPQANLAFEIESIGRFEVLTWAEAERRATAKVSPDTFQTELNLLRMEILSRKR